MKKMSKFIKNNFKGIIIGTIIGILLCGTIGVMAITYFPSNDVTYDNKESGLSSTDVQGAIDELYGICFPSVGNQILEKVPIVTTGDGLYKDEYEEGRYFYKGKNPSNYITFNNEQTGWRIVSIEPDKTIKIMRIVSIVDQYWDTSGSNDWARPAKLNTYLNETYYNGLNSTAKSQIVSKNWSIGGVTYDNNNLSTQINSENSRKWYGKVALVTASEYIRSNSNKSKCGSFSLISDNYRNCQTTTWMYVNDYWYTLSPNARTSDSVISVNISGVLSLGATTSGSPYQLSYPVVYLSSEVALTGSGTQSDPYIVKS